MEVINVANTRCTYQQKETVSIPKKELLEWVVYNSELGKKDLRIILFLLTELDGWQEPKKGNYNDPKNFRIIEIETIADTLDMSVKNVRKTIENLLDFGILEKGDSNSGTNGYRFTF